MAGRGTDIKLSDEVKAAGGLAIIGTERHESRRVDRQLRGRAGRQGDVGSKEENNEGKRETATKKPSIFAMFGRQTSR